MGTLYIVGTPIGNLEDITLRALRILQNVQLIAAEDTRKARILLDRHSIKTPVTSFFEGNERYKIGTIVEALASGDVALISEAGMPGISDPGYPLIQAAIARQIPVVPVPGPSAHTTALVVAGLPTSSCRYGQAPIRTVLMSSRPISSRQVSHTTGMPASLAACSEEARLRLATAHNLTPSIF